MIDAEVGWGIAYAAAEQTAAIWRTTDGGESWADATPAGITLPTGPFSGMLESVFLDGDRAWFAFPVEGDYQSPDIESFFWRTQDGGRTWDQRSLPAWDLEAAVFFHFIDDQHGWFMTANYVGAGSSWFLLSRTQDGGQGWDRLMEEDHAVHEYSVGIEFADENTGLMNFGHDYSYITLPIVRWTRDGGITWDDLLFLPAPADDAGLLDRAFCGTYQPHLFSPVSATLAVNCNDPTTKEQVANLLYTTSDGGSSWQTLPFPGGSIQFLDPQLGWALGHQISHTQDGGRSWTQMGSVPWKGQFSFVDGSRGWAVGETEAASGSVYGLYRTEDAGRTWIELFPVPIH
jgi:photosystem II stability/assembly factor-like uncharacterized protein